jgi:hypothetical protein
MSKSAALWHFVNDAYRRNDRLLAGFDVFSLRADLFPAAFRTPAPRLFAMINFPNAVSLAWLIQRLDCKPFAARVKRFCDVTASSSFFVLAGMLDSTDKYSILMFKKPAVRRVRGRPLMFALWQPASSLAWITKWQCAFSRRAN